MTATRKVKLDKIIKKYRGAKSALINILEDIQEEKNFLPEDEVRYVSEKLGISPSQAFSVATFYRAFSLIPQGKNRIHVCMGTACHIKGAENIIGRLSRDLHIQPGETTEDQKFSLEKVRCLGCCALAPVLRINDDTYSNVTQGRIPKIIEKYT